MAFASGHELRQLGRRVLVPHMRAQSEHRGVVGWYGSELGLHGSEECGKLRVGDAEGVGFHELEEE
jgi:hypothetical protein